MPELSFCNMSKVHPLETGSDLIMKALRPVITVCRIFGIYIGKSNIGGVKTTVEKCRSNLYLGYSILITMLLISLSTLLFINMFAYKPLGDDWIGQYLIVASTSVSTVGHIMASTSLKGGKLQSWGRDLKEYYTNYDSDVGISFDKLIKGTWLWIIINIIVSIAMCLIIICRSVFIPEDNQHALFLKGDMVILNFCLFSGCTFITTGHNTGPICSFVQSYYVISREYDKVNSNFRQIFDEEENRFPDGKNMSEPTEQAIRRHGHICQLLSTFSRVINYYVCTAFLVFLPQCFFLMFILLNYTTGFDNILLICFNVTSCLIQTVFLCYFGFQIECKACDALKYIQYIPKEVILDGRTAQNLSLFVVKLSTTTITYDVLGLFQINSSTILTIVGTIVTYFIVVLQFGPVDYPSKQDIADLILTNITALLQALQNNSTTII